MKIKNILIAVLVIFGMTSCNESKFLDLAPQGSLNDAVLNSTEGIDYLVTSAYAAVAGCASNIGIMSAPVNHWDSGELHADNAVLGGTNSSFVKTAKYLLDASASPVNNWWKNLYSSVKRTNMALRVLNETSVEDVPNVETLKAEMRVLRAHFYFELSRHFNKIVWIDENLPDSEYTSTRNDVYSRDEILGMIAKEFEEAATLLPEKQSDLQRPTKYAAYAYAAKVYLYKAYRQNPANNQLVSIDQSDLAKVLEYTDKVIKSGKYGLLDDFQKLDMVEYENAEESIWAIQYSMNDGATGTIAGHQSSAGHTNWSQILNTPKGPYGGDMYFLPSQDAVNMYQTDENGLPYLNGEYHDMDFDMVKTEGKSYTNYNNTHTVDPRMDFSIGRVNVRWKTYYEPVTANWLKKPQEWGWHFLKRFLVSPETDYMYKGYPWGASQLNYQIIRYANVLLWRAEALIESGRQDDARALINQIRNRAKNSPYVTAWVDAPGATTTFPDAVKVNFNGYASNNLINEYPAAGWTQEYARKALRMETRIELAFEGERFFDLVRWGIAAETMNTYFRAEEDQHTFFKTINFVEGKDEYFPIPLTQYNLSLGAYVQNPGYTPFNNAE